MELGGGDNKKLRPIRLLLFCRRRRQEEEERRYQRKGTLFGNKKKKCPHPVTREAWDRMSPKGRKVERSPGGERKGEKIFTFQKARRQRQPEGGKKRGPGCHTQVT